MLKKTYRTYSLKGLVLHFKGDDGTPIDVTFRSGIHVDSTARFSTTNPKIQKLMEGCSCFNRDFYIEEASNYVDNELAPVEKEEKQVEKEEKPLTDVKDIKRFHNIVEMRNAMADLGFEGVQTLNYAQLKSAASKAGYDFQIQK